MDNKTGIYLKHARLRGFRTVRDTSVDFQPGLNIIIGKNGAGKSNFLHYLKTSLGFNVQSISQHDAYLVFPRGETDVLAIRVTSEIEKGKENGTPVILPNRINFEIQKNGELVDQFGDYNDKLSDFLHREALMFSTCFVTHGLPSDYPLVQKPLSFSVSQNGVLENINQLLAVKSHSFFLENLFTFIFHTGLIQTEGTVTLTKKGLEGIISETETLLNPVKTALEKYADISDLRFNKNYNIVFDKTKQEFSLSNLYMEFKIGTQWLPFTHLSDGTRRLFFIISEVVFPAYFYSHQMVLIMNEGETNKIILIEEPELGLHPQQLDLLMRFLKEWSRKHQIIVTTHAPQVLDILEKDELDRVILARLTKNGTKLKHLTKKEREKAALYMEEEAYLSDYWRFSDLEE